jgi:hypothetical protein
VKARLWSNTSFPPNPDFIGAVLFLTMSLCSCGGGSAPINTQPEPSVSISPTSVTLAALAKQQFTANTAVLWQVNGALRGNSAVGIISNSGLYTAPEAAVSVIVKAVSQVDNSRSASAQLSVLAPHRIGVRPSPSGFAEFYDRSTQQSMIPRGNNYVRLTSQVDPNGNSIVYHSTFNIGLYDANLAELALSGMQTNGYNAVRVFLNGCCKDSLGDSAGDCHPRI